MEQNPRLFCPHCGVQVIATAAYCHACGRAVVDMRPSETSHASPPLAVEPVSPAPSRSARAPSYRGLRATNWVIVALLVPGAALMLLRASSPLGVLLLGSLMAFLVGTFLLTAVTLSRDTFYFAGVPVGAYKATLRKVLFACNAVMLLFGLAGVAACITTQQYGPLLGILVYAILPAMNLKALWILRSAAE